MHDDETRASRRELFVYYRIRPAAESLARVIVLDFQRELMRQHPHLSARLLRKDEAPNGAPTWMETYAMNPPHERGIDAALQATIERLAAPLQACVDGERHVEAFR